MPDVMFSGLGNLVGVLIDGEPAASDRPLPTCWEDVDPAAGAYRCGPITVHIEVEPAPWMAVRNDSDATVSLVFDDPPYRFFRPVLERGVAFVWQSAAFMARR